MQTVTVIVNNRDLLTWPRAMLAELGRFSAIEEVVIVDNASTYRPLLDWYRTLPNKIFFLDNVGHRAPWTREVLDYIKTDFYVVTDPDLDLSAVPRDCLEHLMNCLTRFPRFGKIGLGLEVEDIPHDSPYYAHVNGYERSLWKLPLIEGTVREAPVDTTFAIYHRKILNEYRVCGARTDYPYVAKHIPWSLTEMDQEFSYYVHNAGDSSSYKTFLGDKVPPEREPAHASATRRDMTAEIRAFQIFYDEGTRALLDRDFEPLDNTRSERPDWFEYWPIRDYLSRNELNESALYGFLSPRFRDKTALTGARVKDFAW